MSAALKWVDELPPDGRGRAPQPGRWQLIVEELKKRPGQWALVAEGEKSGGGVLKRYGAIQRAVKRPDRLFDIYGCWPVDTQDGDQ